MKVLAKIFAYYFVWFLSIWSMTKFFNHSDCKVAYGYIVGFFTTMIYSYFMKFDKVVYFVYAVIFYILFLFVSGIFGCESSICQKFYYDLQCKLDLLYIVILLFRSIIINFPILIAIMVIKLEDYIKSKKI